MPELPEVETTRLGLEPLITGQIIESVEVREARLRWPVEPNLASRLVSQEITGLSRRGKYLLIETAGGTLVVHLGMSGRLYYLETARDPQRHDHVDVRFTTGARLRFNDPRRFGSMHLTTEPEHHWLLATLGPEPLGSDFTPEYLWRASRGRRAGIKQHLMNGRVVAGLGNIYANEALFRAGIHPSRAAGRIAQERLRRLVVAIRAVLHEAIEAGGTTLQDFVGGDGRPGYFGVSLRVYGRAGQPCLRCSTPIKRRTLGQRSSYYCPACQR
jgi:formamidopyrimidine-DNA glycosylase